MREICDIDSIAVVLRYTLQPAEDLQNRSCRPEINKPGQTINPQDPPDYDLGDLQGDQPTTEALNYLIKRIKRAAFGLPNCANYQNPGLLYAGKTNWHLLGRSLCFKRPEGVKRFPNDPLRVKGLEIILAWVRLGRAR